MDAYTLYKRIIKCIDDDQIESITFTNLKENEAGQLWIVYPHKKARIKIDAKKGDFLESFIHEMVHFLYPHFGETRVKKWARWWMGNSSWRSKVELIKFLLKIN